MFAGIESTQVNPRRRWTAIASFTLQAFAVAVALTLPLLRPADLPEAFAHRRIFVPVSGNVVGPISTARSGGGAPLHNAPTQRPILVTRDNGVHYGRALAQEGGGPDSDPNVPTGGPGGFVAGPPGIGDWIPTPQKPVLASHQIISVMMQGNLVHRVEPVYPAMAKTIGVQGAVLIRAVISREGNIERAQVLNGSPLLYPSALDAIQHWKYRPYVLNGTPIEVETEITVNFVLQR